MSKNSRRFRGEPISVEAEFSPIPPKKAVVFKPKNASQKELLEKIADHDIVFVTGYAGTGKTFVAGMAACKAFTDKDIESIVVTRPAVEVDNEKMGFLPGELQDKFAPWFEPFRAVFEKGLGTGPLKYAREHDQIKPTPMAYMRGASYENTWLIMDEAQNSSIEQMKMFLTRIGRGSKAIILGDIKQSDIHGVSGLEDAIRRLEGIPGIAVHEFTKEDIVRHGIIRWILERYEN